MSRRDRVRRTAVAALVPLVLAGTAACGGDSDDASQPTSPSVASAGALKTAIRSFRFGTERP